jgi:hypothetical protein
MTPLFFNYHITTVWPAGTLSRMPLIVAHRTTPGTEVSVYTSEDVIRDAVLQKLVFQTSDLNFD